MAVHSGQKKLRYSTEKCHGKDIKNPFNDERRNPFRIGGIVFMLQDEYPDKIPKACRNNQVDRLTDKNTCSRDSDAHRVIETFQDGAVSPAP